LSLLRPPPRSPLFPYTTLFRSKTHGAAMEPSALNDPFAQLDDQRTFIRPNPGGRSPTVPMPPVDTTRDTSHAADGALPEQGLNRSEEHTSELQSQSNLVCRLLL